MGTDKKIDTFYFIFNGLFPIAHYYIITLVFCIDSLLIIMIAIQIANSII